MFCQVLENVVRQHMVSITVLMKMGTRGSDAFLETVFQRRVS